MNNAGCGDAHSMLRTLACIKSAFKKRRSSDPPSLQNKSIMDRDRISFKSECPLIFAAFCDGQERFLTPIKEYLLLISYADHSSKVDCAMCGGRGSSPIFANFSNWTYDHERVTVRTPGPAPLTKINSGQP